MDVSCLKKLQARWAKACLRQQFGVGVKVDGLSIEDLLDTLALKPAAGLLPFDAWRKQVAGQFKELQIGAGLTADQEAAAFLQALRDHVVQNPELLNSGNKRDIFLRTASSPVDVGGDVLDVFERAFNSRLPVRRVVMFINSHILAGRMRGLRKGRHSKTGIRGWAVSRHLVQTANSLDHDHIFDTYDTADSGL